MVRARSRWLGLAVAAAVLLAAGPAAAEEPEAVKTVRLHFDGSAEVDAVQDAGIDLEHGATRVPNGIEVDARRDRRSELLRAIAAGAEVVEPGEEFQWSFEREQHGGRGRSAARSRPRRRCGSSAPTTSRPRVRASSTSRRARPGSTGQTQAPITMRLENDTGAGTPFASPRNMTRFDDSGEYMFHRNLFKVIERPSQIRVTGLTGTTDRRPDDRQRLGLAARRDAADGGPELQVELRQRVQAPAAAVLALRGDRAAVPGDRRDRRRCRTRRTATSARRRRSIGSTNGTANRSAAVVVTLGRVGP